MIKLSLGISMDLEKIGKFIANLRKEKNLTQVQLAEMTGASSYKTVSNWERGNCFPDLVYHEKICEALGIYLEELHSGEFNVERRKRHKRRKIINLFITIYALISIPLIIFLCFFFIYNYDATKVYRLDTKDQMVEVIVNGLLIETNKTKVLYIGNIDIIDYKTSQTDIVKVDIYNDDKLLFHSNNLSSIIVKLEDDVDTSNLKIIVEITSRDKVIYESEIKLNTINISSEYNQIKAPLDSEIELLSEKEIIKNLKGNGFKKEGDDWVKTKETKNKKETIRYFPSNYNLNYDKLEKSIYKNIILKTKMGVLEVYIIFDDKEIHTLLERYTYNYLTKELNCEYGPCATLEEVLEILDPYITLLTGE